MERYTLIHNVRYGYWYNCLQEVLHRRIAFCTNFIQLIAGCSAVAAVAGDSPRLMAAAGLTAAVCAMVSLLLNPSSKEWHFKHMKSKFLELRERESLLSDEKLNIAITRLQREGETGLQLLANPATNMARKEMGYVDAKDFAPTTWLETLVSKFAY